MPLKPFSTIPQNLRDWSRYFDDVSVTPDNLSVDTSKLKNNSVTYVKIQDVTDSRLVGRGVGSAGTAQEIAVSGGLEFNLTSIRRSALTGDVTAAAGSNTLTITPKAVTYADIQDIPTGRLLGRTTALSGSVEEISATSPLALAAGALSIDLSGYSAKSTGTYTGAFTGTATDPAPVLRYSISGSVVVLYVPAASATSNATGFSITGAPAAIRPARTQTVLAILRDNGAVSIGTAAMATNGTLTLGLGVASGSFTGTGTKGIEIMTLTYSLD